MRRRRRRIIQVGGKGRRGGRTRKGGRGRGGGRGGGRGVAGESKALLVEREGCLGVGGGTEMVEN